VSLQQPSSIQNSSRPGREEEQPPLVPQVIGPVHDASPHSSSIHNMLYCLDSIGWRFASKDVWRIYLAEYSPRSSRKEGRDHGQAPSQAGGGGMCPHERGIPCR
jgi:hypothetical protein